MTDLATLRRGRKSFEQRAWTESYRLLHAADRGAPLDAEDLERLAIAAHLVATSYQETGIVCAKVVAPNRFSGLLDRYHLGAHFWSENRSVQRDLLPRKRRLEALLTELDAP